MALIQAVYADFNEIKTNFTMTHVSKTFDDYRHYINVIHSYALSVKIIPYFVILVNYDYCRACRKCFKTRQVIDTNMMNCRRELFYNSKNAIIQF